MKIVFIGSVEFSQKVLAELLRVKTGITGVITRKNADFNSDFCDLSVICSQYNVPYIYAADVNAESTLRWVNKKGPDVIFNFGSSQILKKEILTAAPMGVIGYHPARLPQNRGRHPIVWALVSGLKRTASSFFFMDQGIDSGDILSQVIVDISYKDNARTLYDKLTSTAIKQIKDFLPKLENNSFKKIPQDKSKAKYLRRRGFEDGEIGFNMSSISIYNLVRALTRPYAGAHLIYKGLAVKVWEARESKADTANCSAGTVLKINGREILVKCGKGAVVLTKHEFKKMPRKGECL